MEAATTSKDEDVHVLLRSVDLDCAPESSKEVAATLATRFTAVFAVLSLCLPVSTAPAAKSSHSWVIPSDYSRYRWTRLSQTTLKIRTFITVTFLEVAPPTASLQATGVNLRLQHVSTA